MTLKNVFSFIFIFTLLALSTSSAYTLTEVLTENFSFTEYSDGELTEYVYLIAPKNYPLLTIELQGHGAYEPVFYLYDVEKQKIIYQDEASYNEKITYSFVPEEGKSETSPKEYYLIILSNGKEGSSFDFTYTIKEQNDAEIGEDAPKRFTDAQIIKPGNYTASLGGGDEKDYYAFDIAQDETITIKLTSIEQERLRLELIESSYMTTINQLTPEEGTERTFTSTSDQTIWIGIQGSTEYTLSIHSDKENKMKEIALPPMPPMPPAPKEIITADIEEEKEPLSTNSMILLFLIIVGFTLFGALFLRAKITDRMKAKQKELASNKHKKK